MSELAYCLEHECMTFAEMGVSGLLHSRMFINDLGELDIDWCEFDKGWAYVEPQSFVEDTDWELNIPEPSNEELEEMDKEGNSLWLDLVM